VAQRFGDHAGWYTGAAVAATGAYVILLPHGPRTAALVSLTFGAAWVALLQIASGPYPSGELPLAVLTLKLSQPVLLVFALLAAVIASVGFFSRRRDTAAGLK
jgi:hypothetical protein